MIVEARVCNIEMVSVFNARNKIISLFFVGDGEKIPSQVHGFNAALGGCFFSVESVLWPSPVDASMSLTNTTSMVILSAVIASVVSQVGLGSEPAFKVLDYDFRSIGEKLYKKLATIKDKSETSQRQRCDGCLGLFGHKVDCLDCYERRLQDIEDDLRME